MNAKLGNYYRRSSLCNNNANVVEHKLAGGAENTYAVLYIDKDRSMYRLVSSPCLLLVSWI